MISQRLPDSAWSLVQELQEELYERFRGQLVNRDTIHFIGVYIKSYVDWLRHYGHYVPHFDLCIGVCPFDPTRIEIYDQQNFDYIFPKEREPKMVQKLSL